MDVMDEGSDLHIGSENHGIRCAMCRHFSYFESKAGHNSPHALGRCAGESWDGTRGQWALFQHHCRNFVEAETQTE